MLFINHSKEFDFTLNVIENHKQESDMILITFLDDYSGLLCRE